MMQSNNVKQRVIDYYDQEAPNYFDLYTKEKLEQELYPANTIRLEIILRRLKERKCRTVFDIGTGSGGPLVHFLRKGFDARGIDFSPEMVKVGKKILTKTGFDPNLIEWGDLERAETLPKSKFDAVIATGVFPHNLDDHMAYANVRSLLGPCGFALIEYRNILMSLFSLNQYSKAFFWDDLISGNHLPSNLKKATCEYLIQKFDSPTNNLDNFGKIEFSEILARFHNPLTLNTELSQWGLILKKIYFYHYHSAPPILEKYFEKEFWESSLKLEKPDDWRGYFLASAFVVEIEVLK